MGLSIPTVDTLNLCIEEFIIFVCTDSTEIIFSKLRSVGLHRWCLHGPINSYYSFWWNNLILCRYNVDTLNICMKEFGSQKIILTKWQLWELRQFFPNKAFAYAKVVPSWANQLLPQFLMEQFDTLPIQCRHIEHMHEGVWLKKKKFFDKMTAVRT